MDGPPAYVRDPRVDEYIDALPEWQRDLCQRLRDLIHSVDPEMTETIKRAVQPYFVLRGNVCALLAAKDHVNQTARTVAFRRDEPINVHALTAMLSQIVANNRAGGWRKLKA